MSQELKTITLTALELNKLLERSAYSAVQIYNAEQNTPKKVRGVQRICEMFNIGASTADKWCKTFLAPAVSKIGSVIVIDEPLAHKLVKQESDKHKLKRIIA